MEITDQHVEWAVIDRLLKMQESSHAEYEVTHAYAFFVPIVCWVVQRIRTKNPVSELEKRAVSILSDLKNEEIEKSPWNIRTHGNFIKMSAGDFIVHLRNAIAHGDARNIYPINGDSGSNKILKGFSFKCKKQNESYQVEWEEEIKLDGAALKRISTNLSQKFCHALQNNNCFANDARQHVLEEA